MRRCVNCGATKLTASTVEHKIRVGRRSFAVTVPAAVCAACGESYVAGDDLAHAELDVAARVARGGSTDGAAFRFMRKALGLRAAEVAEALAVRAETVSRWETGKTPVDRAAFLALAAMVDEAIHGGTTIHDILRALGFRGAQAAG
ncbi:MAG TPA: type II TA system antitoxin MqsA family protein [Propionicimonas sp.]|jgi:putative zinc finger/helix-turn-helix YgiT family protein